MSGNESRQTGGCCQPRSRETAYNIIKILLIIYNFFFMLLGFSLLGLGIYSEVMRTQFTEAEHMFVTPSVFLFSMGCIVTIFASIGCIGALRDNFCLLRTFNVCILICILIELGAGVTALVFKDPAKNFVNDYILKGLVTYYDDHDLKNVVDYFQEEFQCCGGRLYKDWEINAYHNCNAPGPSACGVPYSCCIPDPNDDYVINSMCGYDTIQLKKFDAAYIIYLTGCIDAVLDYIWGNLNILAGLLLGIFLPQMTGILLGLFYLDLLKKIISSPTYSSTEAYGLM